MAQCKGGDVGKARMATRVRVNLFTSSGKDEPPSALQMPEAWLRAGFGTGVGPKTLWGQGLLLEAPAQQGVGSACERLHPCTRASCLPTGTPDSKSELSHCIGPLGPGRICPEALAWQGAGSPAQKKLPLKQNLYSDYLENRLAQQLPLNCLRHQPPQGWSPSQERRPDRGSLSGSEFLSCQWAEGVDLVATIQHQSPPSTGPVAKRLLGEQRSTQTRSPFP